MNAHARRPARAATCVTCSTRALVLFAVASLVLLPRPAPAQSSASIDAGHTIPMGRRTYLSQDVTYAVEGTRIVVRAHTILQRHLAGGGWSASATLDVGDGRTHAEFPVDLNSDRPVASVTWNAFRFTVYVIHHTGGAEVMVSHEGSGSGRPST